MSIMHVKVVPLSMFWEDQGNSNLANGNMLISVSDADGKPFTGLASPNFALRLYNPLGQDITAIVGVAQYSGETLPGTYCLQLQWSTPNSWKINGSNQIWRGPYAGDYSLALAVHENKTAHTGQSVVSFVVHKLPLGGF
jgi:hypothetical protein